MAETFLYRREGDLFYPTGQTGSPWSTRLQHGGPAGALLARAVEEAARESGMRIARLTVDLFRPVPREPLHCRWRFVRRGRRVAGVDAWLVRPGEEAPTSRATAVLLRASPGQPPSWEAPSAPPQGPEGLAGVELIPRALRDAAPPGYHWSLEIRMTDDEHGPTAWITSPLDLVEGEAITPVQRCAAAADLTFGLSGRTLLRQRRVATDAPRVAMINVDTTLYWQRPPVGEWFAFRHSLLADEDGVGLAEVTLYDRAGRLGRSLQAMLANERG